MCSLERAFQAAAIEDPDHRSGRLPEAVPKKKKASPGPNPQEAGIFGGTAPGSAPVQGAPLTIAQEGTRGALLGLGSGALSWRATDFAKVTREALGHHLEACFKARFP